MNKFLSEAHGVSCVPEHGRDRAFSYSEVSTMSSPTFQLYLRSLPAAKKVSAAPHRGNANRPLRKQGKANAAGAQPKNQSNLPKAILSNSIQHPLILTNGRSARNLNRRMQPPTRSTTTGKSLRTCPPCPKNTGTTVTSTPVGTRAPTAVGKSGSINSRNANKTGPASHQNAPARNLLSKPLKRLPPPRIPRAMPKQNNPCVAMEKAPNADQPTSTQPTRARDKPAQA